MNEWSAAVHCCLGHASQPHSSSWSKARQHMCKRPVRSPARHLPDQPWNLCLAKLGLLGQTTNMSRGTLLLKMTHSSRTSSCFVLQEFFGITALKLSSRMILISVQSQSKWNFFCCQTRPFFAYILQNWLKCFISRPHIKVEINRQRATNLLVVKLHLQFWPMNMSSSPLANL